MRSDQARELRMAMPRGTSSASTTWSRVTSNNPQAVLMRKPAWGQGKPTRRCWKVFTKASSPTAPSVTVSMVMATWMLVRWRPKW